MKKICVIDVVIFIAIIVALAVGVLTYKNFRQTGENQINSTNKIAFQVFLRGVTITGNENPIKAGDKTFITIRNVPYTKLQVVDSKIETKKVSLASPAKDKTFFIADDFSQFGMYDIIVTVVDTAKITDDGAVVGGNKIKMGLPITLEGQTYKFNGVVSNIQLVQPNPAPSANTQQPSKNAVQNTPAQPQTNVAPQNQQVKGK